LANTGWKFRSSRWRRRALQLRRLRRQQFYACFVGGLLLSGLGASHKKELLRGAEHMGEALALLTWVVFGGIVVARMIDRVTWLAVRYAVLSLTVVRMLPVFLCLIRTRTSTVDKLFIGWFGPRGLATGCFRESGPSRGG
jgi:NhaP-type Na+/H+ or K+/H+ antiporter